jgi:hypothetical protein
MLTIMKISPQGQIRIPRKFMERLGLEMMNVIQPVDSVISPIKMIY